MNRTVIQGVFFGLLNSLALISRQYLLLRTVLPYRKNSLAPLENWHSLVDTALNL